MQTIYQLYQVLKWETHIMYDWNSFKMYACCGAAGKSIGAPISQMHR